MQTKSLARDLTSGSILKTILLFMGPLFMSNILQTVYNIVDMAVVGHYAGSTGLAAVSVGGEAVTLLTFAAFGFSNSGQILVSQYTGANLPERRKQLIGTLFSTLFIISVTLSALTIIFCGYILDFMNIPPDARKDGAVYLKTCAAGMIFVFGYNGVSSILRGMGDSKHPFIFVAISSLMNIALDFLFVVCFSWGVFGVAIATVISQGFSLLCALVFLFCNRSRFGFDFKPKSFIISREIVPLLKLGIPLAFQYCMIQTSKIVVSRWINSYGLAVSAITGIGSKINSIGVTFASAVETSVASIVGQCIGAKKYGRILRSVGIAFILAVSVISAMLLFIFLFPYTFFGLFTPDADVLALVENYLPVVFIMLISSAFRSPMNGLISGTGNARLSLAVAIIDSIVGHIGFAALLGFAFDLGISGIWIGNASAGFVPFVIGLIYIISGKWKRKSLAEQH